MRGARREDKRRLLGADTTQNDRSRFNLLKAVKRIFGRAEASLAGLVRLYDDSILILVLISSNLCRERRTNTRACAVNVRVITYNESVKMANNDASVERTWKVKTRASMR